MIAISIIATDGRGVDPQMTTVWLRSYDTSIPFKIAQRDIAIIEDEIAGGYTSGHMWIKPEDHKRIEINWSLDLDIWD